MKNEKSKILVSACLVGAKVRYDGRHAWCGDQSFLQWMSEGRLLIFCPEVFSELTIPRDPMELELKMISTYSPSQQIRVINKNGVDFSQQFMKGVQRAVDLVKQNCIKVAVLKEYSPSCGVTRVYDGTFSGQIVNGQGVVAKALHQLGVVLFSENQISQAAEYIAELDSSKKVENNHDWCI